MNMDPDAMVTWWKNPRMGGGLRLTKKGFKYMKKVFGKPFIWEFPDRKYLTSALVLDMDRIMNYPYYLEARNKKDPGRIYVYGEKDQVLFALVNDLKLFLDNKKT